MLVDLGEPAAPVARRLLERGMVVRTFSEPQMASCIRISPATPAENDRLLEDLCGRAPARPGVDTTAGR